MTYKEFNAWCNDRACDGCWSMDTAIFCIGIIETVQKKPFWKREKEWRRINKEEFDVVENVVSVINAKIKEVCGGSR